MNKFLISILLAGAAASPALAQDNEHHHGEHENAQAHEQRQQNQQSQQNQQQGRFNGRGNYQQQAYQGQVQQQVQQGQRGGWGGRFNQAPQANAQQQQQQQAYGYRGYRGGFTGQQQQAQQYGTWNGQRGDYRQRQTMQHQYRQGSQVASNWNRNWRNDRRYDWRDYRSRHRSTFHLGIYYDPFGYAYQPFGIGFQLMPAYYSQQFWIDPAMYELPYPPPGAQWVRYWNDAVLVDMYSGQAIDVIQNFFW